jgi:hypothetical protein
MVMRYCGAVGFLIVKNYIRHNLQTCANIWDYLKNCHHPHYQKHFGKLFWRI